MRQHLFEIIDILVAAGVGFFINQVMYPRDEHILVVRAVEHADMPPNGCLGMNAPQKVVVHFFGGGRFKVGNLYASGVHAREKVFNCAILTARIHGLQHNKQAAGVLGIQQLLQLTQSLA